VALAALVVTLKFRFFNNSITGQTQQQIPKLRQCSTLAEILIRNSSMEEDLDIILAELNILKAKLNFLDKISQQESGDIERKYLLLSRDNVKIKMDANKNHSRPHIHVDYGIQFHAVSIAIDSGEVMVGTIPTKYLNFVQNWVIKNQSILLKIWNALRSSENPDTHAIGLSSY
jgi:hypothetical protein